MKRRGALFVLGAGLVAPLRVLAQPKVARIGWLGNNPGPTSDGFLAAFRRNMRDRGYVEGGNYVLEIRWAEGKNERAAELAAEMVRLKVDVIVASGTPQALAAKRATSRIPIVMGASGDPVSTGLVASLARPGGNVTGSAILSSELMLKRLDLLTEALPRARRIAVLINPINPVQGLSVEAAESAAMRRKMTLHRFEARSPAEFETAVAAMAQQGFEALMLTQDGMFIERRSALAEAIAKHRLPAIGFAELAEAGALLGYGADLASTFGRAAYFVDRVLKGANPADLPVEQAAKFDFVVNLKAASALGIKVPQPLVARADKVIE